MNIFLTSTSGEQLTIPLLPEKVQVSTGANVVSASIITLGEVRIPRGTTLTGYAWSGTFPGEYTARILPTQEWQEPARIISLLSAWRDSGETLRLMVTDATIDDDVFIEQFSFEPHGGFGDVNYNISLARRRTLTVSTAPSQAIGDGDGSDANMNVGSGKYGIVTLNKKKGKLAVKQEAKKSAKTIGKIDNGSTVEVLATEGSYYQIPFEETKGYVLSKWVLLTSTINDSLDPHSSVVPEHDTTYTVKAGDTLYTIAKLNLGDGSRYTEIFKLNKKAINKANKGQKVNKYTVEAGMVLQLP